MADYRKIYFDAHPSKSGKYRCACCGKMFPKNQIDIDHRISKRYGGTDELSNLQAMCRHCNRSKGKNSSGIEIAETFVTSAIHGNLDKTIGGIAKRKVKDVFGIKYKR